MPREDLAAIAMKFSPVFATKIDKEWPAADSIAPIDFAGSMKRIADNQKVFFEKTEVDPAFPIQDPPVYYSVVETSTHYFLIYAIYHVMDWWKRLSPRNLYDLIRDRVDEHAHDLEGALVVVRKLPEPTVDGVITVAHHDFYLYSQPRQPTKEGEDRLADVKDGLAVIKFTESVDGNIWLDHDTGRIKLYVQAKGHGMYGDHRHWGGGDQTWYYCPPTEQGNPAKLNSDDPDSTKIMRYHLVDLFAPGGVWEHRFHNRTFSQQESGQWGFVCRKKLISGGLLASGAHAPWSWNDRNDTSPMGEIATAPAQFILRYAQGWGPVSTHYSHNQYFDIA